ncbi:MAG: peptidylprolyl isomerase [Flavobacteriaceae bacterium]
MPKALKTVKVALISAALTLSACKAQYPNLDDGLYAEFITTKGTMVAQLTYKETPVTVANFVSLAEGTNTVVDSAYKGKKFYNGTKFHRVIDNFMIQGGAPKNSDNPGYRFNDEFSSNLKHDSPGILSMANSGPNTNGSQFFITEAPTPHLDSKHSVFGKLIIGLDVQDSISNVKTKNDAPIDPIFIDELNIIRKGKDAKSFDAPKIFNNYFIEKQKLEKEKEAKAEARLKATLEKFDKQKEQATKLPSGLQYFISEKGNGEKLSETSKALTDYNLYFENGKLLETSKLSIAEAHDMVNPGRRDANMYTPIAADLSPNAKMIAGFKEGLQQLNVGDKATLFIPYHLAYGEYGNRGIPPKSNLIFEVEVVELSK